MFQLNKCLLMFLLSTAAVIQAEEKESRKDVETVADLKASPTSAKLFNLGSLFGQTPTYPYGYGSYGQNTNYYRPQYSTTGGGYYPSTYYPTSTSWTGNQYYPNQGYYGNSGSYYPSTGSNYPTNGYYPTGTNILGSNGGYGGYGGYGGNGGLRQYYGYWSPDYTGQRNRGFGYFANTDRYGLPRGYWRGGNDYGGYRRARDRFAVSSRGYD